MAKNKPNPFSALVYSTNPNVELNKETEAAKPTEPPNKQPLKIQMQTKHRAGKAVTIVFGFIGTNADMEQLGKQLKTHCGSGGAVKDGEIIIQGDHRTKVLEWLVKNGYTQSKKI